MSAPKSPHNLDELLDCLEEPVREEGQTTVGKLVEALGSPSFGPLLVAIGLAGVTPLSAVPTVPTLLAVCAVLVTIQLVIGRKHFWLPRFIRERTVTRGRIRMSTRMARKPARVVDHVLKQRLTFLTGQPADRLVALVVLVISTLR